MTVEALYSLAKLALLWLGLVMLLSRISGALFPLFRRMGRHGDPRAEALTLLIYCAIPPAAAAVIVLLIYHPSVAGALVPFHCHQENCLAHTPLPAVPSDVGAMAVALLSYWALVVAVALQRRLRSSQRRLEMFVRLSQTITNCPYSLVDGVEPMAWTVGLLRPRVVLSRALVALLDQRQLQAVVLHELAHSARRDNLRRLIVQLATQFWSCAPRRQLIEDFHSSTERACDQIAARQLRDALPLAHALETLGRHGSVSGASRIPGHRERIAALESCATSQLPGRWLGVFSLWATSIVLLTGIGHRLLELLPI